MKLREDKGSLTVWVLAGVAPMVVGILSGDRDTATIGAIASIAIAAFWFWIKRHQ